MDPKFLQYYNDELRHVREMGAEFARDNPKIASRLGMENLECADPYVERLLESFAFMAARVHLKLDAQYPQFAQHLFEMVYPHYLTPLPSMAVVQFSPDLADPNLVEGYKLPRHSNIVSGVAKDQTTSCTYRTSHDLTFWPLELTGASYFSTAGAISNLGVSNLGPSVAGLRLSLRCTAGSFNQLKLDSLPIYLGGVGDIPKALYEQLLGNCSGIVLRPKGASGANSIMLGSESLQSYGFDADQALLPYTKKSFEGYRLIQEYLTFPERFMFVEFSGLGPFLQECTSSEIEIFVLLDTSLPWLEDSLDHSHFSLFCAPVINLFRKRADRIVLESTVAEQHVLADRTKPMDYEIHSIEEVRGMGSSNELLRTFNPFYTSRDPSLEAENLAYFSVRREPRKLSSRQRRTGARSSYIGTETFISIVDAKSAPYAADTKQLEVFALCTNRDLPLHLTTGLSETDFTLDDGGPVKSIRCVASPTSPKAPSILTESSWRLLSHLSLNYISLIETENGSSAQTLKEMLSLYADMDNSAVRRQVNGLLDVEIDKIVRRLPEPGMISFARGLEITLTCDEEAFAGTGAFMFGLVMKHFLSKYVSLNSFVETVLRSNKKGEIMRWQPIMGRQQKL